MSTANRFALLAKAAPFMIRSLWTETQTIQLFNAPYVLRSNRRKIGVDGRISAYRETYAHEILASIESFATPTSAFLDIGANTGFFSRYWLTHWNKKVGAFEPDPITFGILRANVPDALLVQKAASNACGTARFAQRSDYGSSGLAVQGESYIEVPQITLDSWLPNAGLDGPLVVKIDVEGFDPLVIQGMKQTIADRHPVIVSEWLHDQRCSNEDRAEAVDILVKNGYSFRDVSNGARIKDLARFRGDFAAWSASPRHLA